jgi:hypothetical protein
MINQSKVVDYITITGCDSIKHYLKQGWKLYGMPDITVERGVEKITQVLVLEEVPETKTKK